MTVHGGRGPLTVVVEIFDVVPGTRMVEFQKAKGDSVDFYQFYAAITKQARAASVHLSGNVIAGQFFLACQSLL